MEFVILRSGLELNGKFLFLSLEDFEFSILFDNKLGSLKDSILKKKNNPTKTLTTRILYNCFFRRINETTELSKLFI